jgi:hypothetical protein
MRDRTVCPETAMHPAAPAAVHRLARDRVLRLAAPLDLRARAGTLWVTVDGQLEDIVLEAGEAHRFDARGTLLVCALGNDASFQVQPLAPAWRHGVAARLAGWLGTRPALPAPGARA